MTNKVYKKKKADNSALLVTISSGCKTPLLTVRFSTLVKAFYYPNSPQIPRYSITCIVDPIKHKDFLEGIKSIEKNEQVESLLKRDYKKVDGQNLYSGDFNLKFQTKDIIPVFIEENSKYQRIMLEDELDIGEEVIIEYDILRYTKKNSDKEEYALSFKPTAIFYYPSEEKKENIQEAE